MQETVESGTGTDAKVAGYSMGGKTGTAQKIPRDSGNYLVSFIGFAPADDPQLLIYVIVDQPNVEDQGTSVYAQQIAKNILTELLPYMNIFPDEEVTTDTAATDTTEQTTEDASVQSADTQTTDTGEAESAQEVSEEAAVQETEAQADESASEESADGSPPEDETQAENTQ